MIYSLFSWPKDIVPEDPGYVLMTNDKWYDSHEGYPNAKLWRNRYASAPSRDEIEAAQNRQTSSSRHDQASKKNSPRAVGAVAEGSQFDRGPLIARDLKINATRPLTDGGIRHQIEVVLCKDKECSAWLQGRDIDDAAVLPAILPSSAPSANHDAVPTPTPTKSMRTETKAQKRTNVFPDLPNVTS